MKIRGIFEFNCSSCGQYKAITSPALYKYRKESLYCCCYSCFEKLKIRLKENKNQLEI